MDYAARTATKRHADAVANLAKIETDTQRVREQIGKPFPKAEKLKAVQERAAELEGQIGRKKTAVTPHVDRPDAQEQPPARKYDSSNDPEVRAIIDTARAGDKGTANKMFLALHKSRKWSDEQKDLMVEHILAAAKAPVEESPEDNPLSLSQSSVSLEAREQAYLDLRAEIARLFPLSTYGA